MKRARALRLKSSQQGEVSAQRVKAQGPLVSYEVDGTTDERFFVTTARTLLGTSSSNTLHQPNLTANPAIFAGEGRECLVFTLKDA